MGARDRPRRRAGGRPAAHGRRPLGDARAADARARLDRGGARPPPDRRHRGLLGPERVGAGPSSRRAASRSSSSTRPANRSTTRHRSGRRTGTAAWPRRATCSGSATAGSRSSAGRPGSCAAAPGWTAIGRPWTRPASRSIPSSSATATSRSTRASGRAARCSADRIRRRPIIAGNDLQALGVYQAAREARLHIPEDLSVVGFDDLPVARWVGPPLTTVRQPLVEMAVAAAELVLAMARGEQPGQTRVELATELVIRESTAPPRA